MRNSRKTEGELLQELRALRQRIAELEQSNHEPGGEGVQGSEAHFREIFENTQVGVYRTTPDGRVLMANPALVRMLGCSCFEELAQRNLEEKGYEPQYSRSVFKHRIEKEGQVVGLESAWVRQDGTTLFVIENARAIRDENDNTLYYEGTAENITERKKAEKALEESERRFRAIFDNTSDGIFLLDLETNKFSMCNKAFLQMLGYTQEELMNLTTEDLHPKEDLPFIYSQIQEFRKGGRGIRHDIRFRRRDGSTLLTDLSPNPVTLGARRYVLVAVRDVTEQKKAEERLRQSEERMRALMDATTESVLLADRNMRILAANRTAVQRLGKSAEELTGRGPDELGGSPFPPAVLESRAQKAHQVICSGKPVRFEDERAGIVFDTNMYPIFNEAGQVYQVAVFARDITEHKKAEEKLRQSEERLLAMMNATTESVLLVDGDLKILSINKMGAKRLGKSVEELVGCSMYDIGEGVVPRSVLESRVQQVHEVIRSGKPVRMEDERAGIVLDSNLYPLFDSEGQVHQVAVFARDITERKLAEQALRQSEQKYRTLVENLPQRVFLKDRNSIYVSCNENLARDLGISPELLPGKSDYDFFAAELAEKYRADDKRIMESGEISDIEEVYTRGGKEMIVHTVKAPVRDEQGNVTGVLGIFWDVTERSRLQRALRESEERYRTLVENAGESIVTLNRDGLHLFMNKTGAERFGGKPEDFIGKTVWDVFPRDVAESRLAMLRMVIDTGQRIDRTEKIQAHGQERWYHATIEPLRDSTGKVIAAMVIARDIHEARQAETELEVYRQKMAQADRLASLGTLSATLVHELTQPLTVITLSIEDSLAELEKISCPQIVTDELRDSLSAVSNVTSIAERFRNFARKSSEKTIDRVELGAVAERIVKLLNMGAQQAGIKLHLGRLDKLPAVYLNEKDLEQLFFALVQNAVQAADGKEGRELLIDGAVKGGFIELRFSDDCGGIQPENLDNIFDPFFTTKPAGEGTGLGLCIVQRIAERSGGEVRVENRPGEGATFIVTLGIDRNRT